MKSRLLGAICAGLIVSSLFNAAQAAAWGVEVGVSTLSPCPSSCRCLALQLRPAGNDRDSQTQETRLTSFQI